MDRDFAAFYIREGKVISNISKSYTDYHCIGPKTQLKKQIKTIKQVYCNPGSVSDIKRKFREGDIYF